MSNRPPPPAARTAVLEFREKQRRDLRARISSLNADKLRAAVLWMVERPNAAAHPLDTIQHLVAEAEL